ncbi:MAG: site-2 protease family protein [Promethearchaeota archaeon]
MSSIDFFYNIITDPFFLISGIFWILVYLFYKIRGKEKESIIIGFPFYAIFRTRKLNAWLRKLGRKYAKFWRIFFTIGVFVSFGFLVYGIYFFINNLVELFIAPKPENIIQPLVPGVTIEFSIFSYLILPLGLCIIFHEFSHAMASEADNLDLKSTGLIFGGLFYIILPGAFVEPDEYKIKSRNTKFWTKLRISGAGTFANAIQTIIALLLLINFSTVISPFYGPKVFQIAEVIPSIEGGFNEGNVLEGDIIFEINNTKIDLTKGIDLTAVLNNETNIKCFIGDTLLFKGIDKNGNKIVRNITLGPHYFIGFEYTYISDTILEITEVYDKYQGGNNYKSLTSGMKFQGINGYYFNLSEGRSLGIYLKEYASIGKVNFTLENNQNISIYIDYFPLVYGAFEFRNFYLGAFFKTDSEYNVYVERVLSSLTETGINDKNLLKGDKITKVNGIALNISANYTFEDFLNSVLGPVNDEQTAVFTVIPSGSSQEVDRNVIIKPIPKSYVFIGVRSQPYWYPKNWFSNLLGSNFAIWLERETFYFYMIGFSLTLFNMMPMIIPPLDGYMMMKEIIAKIIGIDLNSKRQKKVKILLEPNKYQYLLNTYYIIDVKNVELEILERNNPNLLFNSNKPKYRLLDTINDGYIDTIEFDKEELEQLESQVILKVDLEYLYDRKEKVKKVITWGIGFGIFILIILNFIFSYVFLRNIMFWL